MFQRDSWIGRILSTASPQNRHPMVEQKKGQLAIMLAYSQLKQPIWTPVQYDALSRTGYQNNIIVYRAVNLIARGIASVPFLLYRQEEEIEQHPLLNLLKSPNPMQSGPAFMESMVSYFLLSGNTYVEAVQSTSGSVQEMYVLRPDRMRIVPSEHGIPSAYDYMVGGQTKRVSVDLLTGYSPILHLKFFHPLDDWYGLSPLEAALRSIDLHNTISGHNLSILQNGGRPSGALIVSAQQNLTAAQRDELRESLMSTYQGAHNAGKLAILEGGMGIEWKEMGLSPKDLDFGEGKNLSAREIAQAFGVPPMLVGVPGDANFSNYKEARLHLWEDTILPLLDRLVSHLNSWLAPQFEEGLRLAYDVDAVPTLESRRERTWKKISDCTFLTLNEKRQAVGYGPVEGGDRLDPNINSSLP